MQPDAGKIRRAIVPIRSGGWVLLEILWSVIIMTALAGVLALAARRDEIGLAHLSDSRASARVAESVLTSLQQGHPAPTAEDATISVRQLSTPSDAPRMVWVEVSAVIADASPTMSGISTGRNSVGSTVALIGALESATSSSKSDPIATGSPEQTL